MDGDPGVRDLEPREQEAVRLMQEGALPQAEALLRAVLSERPEDHQILNALGVITAQLGRLAEAIGLFERALEQAPGDAGVAGNLTAAKQNMTLNAYALIERQAWPQALSAYREILACDPDNTIAPNAFVHCVLNAGETPRLADFAPGLREAELGRHIFIACMPKSGSTFLRTALMELTGWPEAYFTYAFLQNEEELYLPHLRAAARQDTVTQQHCRATVPNLQLMQAFAIRPIVLVRNLFDALVSYTDFFDGGATVNTFFAGRWAALDRGRRIDLVIDYFVPWYLTFFASWLDAMAKRQLDCHFLRYEDMIADKQAALERLAAFYDLDKTPADCAAALAAVEARKDTTRFNKGIAGRGEALSEEQKDRIHLLADYYHDIDFSPVGL
jgi:tetratricopeptide (TPR) repeat protein